MLYFIHIHTSIKRLETKDHEIICNKRKKHKFITKIYLKNIKEREFSTFFSSFLDISMDLLIFMWFTFRSPFFVQVKFFSK